MQNIYCGVFIPMAGFVIMDRSFVVKESIDTKEYMVKISPGSSLICLRHIPNETLQVTSERLLICKGMHGCKSPYFTFSLLPSVYLPE